MIVTIFTTFSIVTIVTTITIYQQMGDRYRVITEGNARLFWDGWYSRFTPMLKKTAGKTAEIVTKTGAKFRRFSGLWFVIINSYRKHEGQKGDFYHFSGAFQVSNHG